MSDPSAKRVLIYTALFAGGSLLAAPSLGMSAGIVAGAAAVASLFGNTLASDIHSAVTAASANPNSSDDLRLLTLRALAQLIEQYRAEYAARRLFGKLVKPFSRHPDPLSALGVAARAHWRKLELTVPGGALDQDQAYRAFVDSARTDGDPYITADDWEDCFSEIASDAATTPDVASLPSALERRALAEYVAPRFSSVIRELVHADLDPATGSGGRVFVALHLDLMRSMASSLRSSDAKSDDTRALVAATRSRINELSEIIIHSLSTAQRVASQTILDALQDCQRRTQDIVAQGFAAQDLRSDELAATLKDVQAALATIGKGNAAEASLDNVLQAIRDLAESGEARGMRAMELSQEGRFADAASEAFDLARNDALAAEHLGNAAQEAQTRAGKRWLSAGDLAFVSDHVRAIEAYLQCTKVDPSNPYGWSRLGEASWWVGQLDEALRAFTRLWYLMPEGISALLRATDPPARQEARFIANHPDVPLDAYLWSVRGVMIAGLNIIEILTREPSLITQWVVALVPVGEEGHVDGDQRRPTESEAATIIQFFSDRAYGLGSVLGAGAASAEHRRILSNLSQVAIARGEFEHSDQYLRRARDMSVAEHDFVAQATYLSNLGVVAMHRGQVNTAHGYMAEALAICEGDSAREPLFINFRDIRRSWLARQPDAVTSEEANQPGDRVQVCNLLDDRLLRDPVAAVKDAFKLKEVEGNVHGNLGHIARLEGQIDLARSEYDASLAAHQSIGFEPGIVATQAALSRLPMS